MITIGTDYSGIESPLQALNKLKIPYKHLWSCDYDKFVKKSILSNYSPEVFYDDIKIHRTLPNVDIYVAGFPCQPFSLAGQRLAENDKRGRIFEYCVRTIKKCKPKCFILENVRGLLSTNYWNYILEVLSRLKQYNIYHKVLNTKDYRIPQSRERIYIVGIHKNFKNKFNFPITKK